MRVKCPHCQKKAIITHRVNITPKMDDVYINCTNIDCAAHSVLRLSHTATLIPPASILTNAMHEWFANLPETEQRSISKRYQPSLF